MKQGGQALVGGLDICVSRNFFGAQVSCMHIHQGHVECRIFGGGTVCMSRGVHVGRMHVGGFMSLGVHVSGIHSTIGPALRDFLLHTRVRPRACSVLHLLVCIDRLYITAW
jgi:hypothetical protein